MIRSLRDHGSILSCPHHTNHDQDDGIRPPARPGPPKQGKPRPPRPKMKPAPPHTLAWPWRVSFILGRGWRRASCLWWSRSFGLRWLWLVGSSGSGASSGGGGAGVAVAARSVSASGCSAVSCGLAVGLASGRRCFVIVGGLPKRGSGVVVADGPEARHGLTPPPNPTLHTPTLHWPLFPRGTAFFHLGSRSPKAPARADCPPAPRRDPRCPHGSTCNSPPARLGQTQALRAANPDRSHFARPRSRVSPRSVAPLLRAKVCTGGQARWSALPRPLAARGRCRRPSGPFPLVLRFAPNPRVRGRARGTRACVVPGGVARDPAGMLRGGGAPPPPPPSGRCEPGPHP